MRIFVACLLAVAIVAGGAYAVLRSVQQPRSADGYTTGSRSYTTGSSRSSTTAPLRPEWQGQVHQFGFDE